MDIEAPSVRSQVFAEQNRPPVAEHGEVAELVARVRLGQRFGARRQGVSGENLHSFRGAEGLRVQTELGG